MMFGRIAIATSLLFALPPAPPPRGFFPETATAHRTVEERYRSLPDPAAMREAMRILAAEPHHLGSAQGEKNARWILERFREWGLDASIETFHVLFPTPKERLVEMLEPTRFRASLAEPALPRIRPRHRRTGSCRRTTPTPSTGTSPGRSST